MSGTTTAVTDRVTLKVAGYTFTQFSDLTIERDLENVAGRFSVTALDQNRIAASLAAQIGEPPSIPVRLLAGEACELLIDGETVLVGWIDKVNGKWTGKDIGFQFTGRDKTGDLVDCAAFPTGPAELRGMNALQIAQLVCKPFGIPVTADVDPGAPFPVLATQPHENALPFLEKTMRQRALLLTSDGVGGLKLTRGGSTRAAAPLRIGELIQEAEWEHDETERFGDYYVKGQTPLNRTGTGAPLTTTVTPLSAPPAPPSTPGTATATEQQAVVMTGHAIDPEVKRYRPTVRMVRTQSGMSTVQEQAEWAARVAKGKADRLTYDVLDWRAGLNNALWLANQVTAVYDPYAGIDQDMLICGVSFQFGEKQGLRTKLRVVGRAAYDLIDLPVRRRGSSRQTTPAGPLTTTVSPLTAP